MTLRGSCADPNPRCLFVDSVVIVAFRSAQWKFLWSASATLQEEARIFLSERHHLPARVLSHRFLSACPAGHVNHEAAIQVSWPGNSPFELITRYDAIKRLAY